METIFYKVLMKIVDETLCKINETSASNDNTLKGSIFRDMELSKKKRDFIEYTMKPAVRGIMPGKRKNEIKDENPYGDEMFKQELKKTISINTEQGNAIALKNNTANHGNFGKIMPMIELFIDHFYTHMEKNDLINVPNAQDPLSIFLYNAALYEGKKLLERNYRTFKGKNIPNLQLSNDKSRILLDEVRSTRQHIKTVSDDAPEEKLNNVLHAIKRVIQSNLELCNTQSIRPYLPLTIGVFSIPIPMPQKFGPGEGNLKKTMLKAIDEIKCLEQNSSKTVTPDDAKHDSPNDANLKPSSDSENEYEEESAASLGL